MRNFRLSVLFRKTKGISISIAVLFGIFFCAGIVLAGFGISPPFVKNFHLSPGSHYEQEIVFSRADAKGDSKVEVTIADAPEIEKWISIDKGMSFLLPDGQKQTPMKVLIDVPKDAKFANYQGKIRVKVLPAGGTGGGEAVSIVLGGEISVNLTVTPEQFYDFIVKLFGITEVEQGRPVKVLISIENKGNVAAAPTNVHLDIYDQYMRLITSGDDTNLELVPSFETKDIFAKFSAKLAIGYYWGDIKIFKGDELMQSGKIYFGVVERKNLWSRFTRLKPVWQIAIGSGVLIFFAGLILLVRLKRKRAKERYKTW